MDKKRMIRVIAVCTVLMLMANAGADELSGDPAAVLSTDAAPVVLVDTDPTEVPPQRTDTPVPADTPSIQSEDDEPTVTPTLSANPATPATPTASATAASDPTDSAAPSASPSASPSTSPDVTPSVSPSASPHVTPSESPETSPSASPSASPDATAPASPSASPEVSPSVDPSVSPSTDPSASPSVDPSASPSVEPSASPTAEPLTILTFAPLDPAEAVFAEKPLLEDVLAALPAEIQATLTDEAATVVSVPVAWSCADYAAEADQYIFAAAMNDTAYTLSDTAVLPTFTVRIEAPSEFVVGDFTFRLDENGCMCLVGYSAEEAFIANVPAEVNGQPVAAVMASAFAGHQTLAEIVLPAGVVSIEDGAFANCAALTKLRLPDSLESVGSGLFDGCVSLTHLALDVSMETSLTSPSEFTRKIVETDENGVATERTVAVALDRPFTDLCVLESGALTLQTSFTVDSDHSVTVSSGGALKLSSGVTLIVNGALSNAGNAANDGQIIACGGSVTGMTGSIRTDHSYTDGVCDVCGARQTLSLAITPNFSTLEKTYDGYGGVSLSAQDFTLSGVRQGDDVRIASVSTNFTDKNVGRYLITASFQLGGADAAYYTAAPMELSVAIHKKQVTVTPRDGQSKTYGASDPSLRAGYRGIVSGETLSGKLAREKGESVGKYKITIGTVADSNPNYEIVLKDGWFEITAKSIDDSSITPAKIPNQRYTGSAITPAVTLTDGGKVLVEGTDYTVSYESNTSAGSAKAIVTGMGNYTGTRTVSFRIIKVNSGSNAQPSGSQHGSGGSGGSGSVTSGYKSLEDWTAGYSDAEAPSVPAQAEASVETYSEGNLFLGEINHGVILYDTDEAPHGFFWSERTVELQDHTERWLLIEADLLLDDFGEPIEGEYGQPRLRLTMPLIETLRMLGYTHVELSVGAAQARIPLDTLHAGYESGDLNFLAGSYEIRLWPLRAEVLAAYEAGVFADLSMLTESWHFEMLVLPLDGSVDADGQPIPTQDVLSLMDGVQLLLAPAELPADEVPCKVMQGNLEDPAIATESESAVFAEEDGEVKCVVTPLSGGVYVLTLA